MCVCACVRVCVCMFVCVLHLNIRASTLVHASLHYGAHLSRVQSAHPPLLARSLSGSNASNLSIEVPDRFRWVSLGLLQTLGDLVVAHLQPSQSWRPKEGNPFRLVRPTSFRSRVTNSSVSPTATIAQMRQLLRFIPVICTQSHLQ